MWRRQRDFALWDCRDKLRPTTRKPLNKDGLIEDWVAADPSLLGLEALIIGQQVPTDQGKFIDLLAMDATSALVIIESKKDRTSPANCVTKPQWIS